MPLTANWPWKRWRSLSRFATIKQLSKIYEQPKRFGVARASSRALKAGGPRRAKKARARRGAQMGGWQVIVLNRITRKPCANSGRQRVCARSRRRREPRGRWLALAAAAATPPPMTRVDFQRFLIAQAHDLAAAARLGCAAAAAIAASASLKLSFDGGRAAVAAAIKTIAQERARQCAQHERTQQRAAAAIVFSRSSVDSRAPTAENQAAVAHDARCCLNSSLSV